MSLELEQLNKRFDHIDERFDHLEHLLQGIADTLAQMMKKMDAEFAASRIQIDRLIERVDHLEHIHGIN